ncbi:HlyD family secretion protein [Sulfurovum sp. NBC37-1]|uniref:HlyD family secretion protein n=1 Tax=Sulfurovum sp. (strain NBC37-1) TaxID=387093 RepID=UPI0001587617|nr:HlyD family efflux transporter periplasmic adaptor subunit [Sulfurovum sp. NBC37-1]BAF71237.1 efflux system, membrane fusion protein [Sulfurovum sp. NBC37-1]
MQIIKKYWIGIVAAILIVIAGVMIYAKLHPKTLPKNLVEGTGRIDGDLTNLNTKYPGRVEKITVDDGTVVKKGMIVAILGSKEYEAQKTQIEAQISAQKKTLEAKQIELEISRTTIPAGLKKAQEQLKSTQTKLKVLEENIKAQQKVLAQAKKDHERSVFLYKSKAIDSHAFELSKLKVDTEQDKYDALLLQRDELKAAISVAQSVVKEAQASQKQILSIESSIEALKENIKALEASKAQVESIIAELTLKSPIDGYTVEKIANVGEVVGAGMPVATLIDPRSLYLKIFVDTLQNGRIKIGDKAVIFLDAYPNRPIEAKVVNVAQQAEFTPKEVSVRSDRIQRVFAVHLKPLKVDPLLKLGIPAIGVISIDGKGLPRSLDEIPVL